MKVIDLLNQITRALVAAPMTIGSPLWNDPNSNRPKIVNSANAVWTRSFFLRSDLPAIAELLQQPLLVFPDNAFFWMLLESVLFYDDYINYYHQLIKSTGLSVQYTILTTVMLRKTSCCVRGSSEFPSAPECFIVLLRSLIKREENFGIIN